MARSLLPPGFRFHPTDVELIMYYLKRKVMGKKLHPEAIAEVNIYNFSPWDLPDKSCLKSKDMEWFFFCPRERKYASGVRVKRATETGYWKTTGKDRPIVYNDRTVGSVKTLIFHLGHAPKGDRTDWVIYEYTIIDEQLVAAGVHDSYVLCKVFKKSGLGPKNGAQYGAPFNEADWDDDVNDGQDHSMSCASGGPSLEALVPEAENQSSVMKALFNPASAPEPSVIDNGDENLGSVITGLDNIGSTSGLIEGGPSDLAGPTSGEALMAMSEDEMFHLLSSFTDDSTLLPNKNGGYEEDLNDKRKNKSSLCLDGYDIFNGLGDLDRCFFMSEDRFDTSAMQKDGYPLNNMFLQDNSGYIELNDLLAPLNYLPEVTGTEQLYDIFGSHNHENTQQFCSASGAAGIHQYDCCKSQLPMSNDESNRENSSFGVLQSVNKLYWGHNAVYDSEFTQSQPDENKGQHSYQNMQSGRSDNI